MIMVKDYAGSGVGFSSFSDNGDRYRYNYI